MKKVAMKNRILILLILLSIMFAKCDPKQSSTKQNESLQKSKIELNREQAVNLAQLPLKCVGQEFPNKLNQTLNSDEDLANPKQIHPAFYGCFDWHSSVHGHWMLVKLLKIYPNIEIRDQIIENLTHNITKENILLELAYFEKTYEKSYERTYGWAWLLKLAEELHTWDEPLGKILEENLQPLTNLIVERYLDFLPRLNYPIRVGEHTNTAFGLSFAYDYVLTLNDTALKAMIEKRARQFYLTDENCPLNWEPSGFDFLSPCLEEANLMRRILPVKEFKIWFLKFLPEMAKPAFTLKPAEVSDRSDGKLVHLDGLNFSRAWCLYGIASDIKEYDYLKEIARKHIEYSLPNIASDTYEGGHWLASFAVYALDSIE